MHIPRIRKKTHVQYIWYRKRKRYHSSHISINCRPGITDLEHGLTSHCSRWRATRSEENFSAGSKGRDPVFIQVPLLLWGLDGHWPLATLGLFPLSIEVNGLLSSHHTLLFLNSTHSHQECRRKDQKRAPASNPAPNFCTQPNFKNCIRNQP